MTNRRIVFSDISRKSSMFWLYFLTIFDKKRRNIPSGCTVEWLFWVNFDWIYFNWTNSDWIYCVYIIGFVCLWCVTMPSKISRKSSMFWLYFLTIFDKKTKKYAFRVYGIWQKTKKYRRIVFRGNLACFDYIFLTNMPSGCTVDWPTFFGEICQVFEECF